MSSPRACPQPDELLIGAIGVETNKTESFTAGAGYTDGPAPAPHCAFNASRGTLRCK